MSRVLVTGACGFIGRHLGLRLRAEGHDIVEVDRASGDVAEQATWKDYPPADVVVHLAANSFVPGSWDSPADFFRTNLLGTIRAVEYCRVLEAHLVFPSSYLYGDPIYQPVAEGARLAATNPYALSKKMAEEACRFFADEYGIPITVLRPFNIYGPGQSDTFLVPTILSQLRAGREVHVMDLGPRRDYVYILDVVDAIVKAITCPVGFRVFNIGSGASHSVEDLIRTMQDVWGTDLPVRSDGIRRKGEVMDTVADIRRAEQELGWRPRFSLRQGLEHLHRVS